MAAMMSCHDHEKCWGSIVSNQIRMKFGRIVLLVNGHWLMDLVYWYGVILSRWQPWRLPTACCCICWLPASLLSAVTSLARYGSTVPDPQYICSC